MDPCYSQQQSVGRSNSNSSSTTPVSGMKPLTERQQMALLLQMTSEDNTTPSRKGRSTDLESPSSGQRSVHRRNDRGETQLQIASIKGDAQRVRELINQGADVNTTDYAGWTPLHEVMIHILCILIQFIKLFSINQAANRGLVSVARELLKNGAKVNVTGLDGVTPLHDASVNGHESMISLLLRYGANSSLKTSSHKTALDLAGSPEVVRLLAQQISDEEDRVTDENSPETMPQTADNSWKVQKQHSKSRRSLHLGK